MKEFFAKTFYHNTIGDWAVTLAIIIGAVIAGKILYWIFGNVVKKITSKTKTRIDDIIIDMIEEPIVLALTIAGLWYGLHRLTFPEDWLVWMGKVYHILIAINITWLAARLIDAIVEEYVVPLTEKTESTLDDQILPVARKSMKSGIWILGIIVALNNAGYDVGALIAGLGIGGLALAMAAKDSVSNIFGGLMVFFDKPFKVGDRIKINGFDGTIEEIHLRTSRMRTLQGTLVTIPNAQFTGSMVENITAEPSRKIVLNLGLVYDMTPEQMEKGLELLKQIAAANENVEDNYLVSFNAFGDFALGLMLVYYIKKGSDILNTQSEMNLSILKEFNANGLEMAFPTQTIYTKK
ncbi:MAG: mechanosensitive ion channel family protein [Flavobacteriales bacterium]|nr:mechanosensitive ion channel family protein [Flavobacteriales bacterium]